MRPLHTHFDELGVTEALRRLELQLRYAHPRLVATRLAAVPGWLALSDGEAPSASLAHRLTLRDAMDLVHNLRAARLELQRGPSDQARADASSPLVDTPEHHPRVLVALVRLAYGELLEAFAAQSATVQCPPGEPVAATDAAHARTARLFHDAYLAAVWTSAQAQFVVAAADRAAASAAAAEDLRKLVGGSNNGERHCAEERQRLYESIDALPSPELHAVACASNQPDLLSLYERGGNAKACGKAAAATLTLLVRCTNAGNRGWETALASSLDASEGASIVCQHAFAAVLSGLHPGLHPAARPDWRDRLLVLRDHPLVKTRAYLVRFGKMAAGAVKEAMRAYLAALIAMDPATLCVQTGATPANQHLALPPAALPAASLQTALTAFAAMGATSMRERVPCAEVARRLTAQLVGEGRTRSKRGTSAPSSVASSSTATGITPSWLLSRAGAPGALPPSARSVVAGLMAASFRSEFVPFWMHSHSHGQRASRLDAVQFASLHDGNALHQLTSLLDAAETLRLQRMALERPVAALMSVQDALHALECDVELQAAVDAREARGEADLVSVDGTDSESGSDAGDNAGDDADLLPGTGVTPSASRAVQDAETLLLDLRPDRAAHLIVFAQRAALRDALLAYELGPRTRVMQARALHRRFLRHDATLDSADAIETEADVARVVAALPPHATKAYACSECRRIVNAVQDGTGRDVGFTELGLASSMLRVTRDVCAGEMRCAKRSSAALRTALSLEQAADQNSVEGRQIGFGAAAPSGGVLPVDLRPVSVVGSCMCAGAVTDGAAAEDAEPASSEGASEVAKLRRDTKNSFEQRPQALACGDAPLVCIPILGRAVRVYGEWYGLCALCGALARLSASSRYGTEPCCMRCDCSMLFGEAAERAVKDLRPKADAPRCRLCGKSEPEAGKWRKVKAPADTGGRNSSLPAPLRVCHYCPTHWRPWLTNAHRSMATNVIFAHIIERAKPCWGADEAAAAPMPRLARKHGRQGSLGGASSGGPAARRKKGNSNLPNGLRKKLARSVQTGAGARLGISR